jgi:molecular chaperone GrpE
MEPGREYVDKTDHDAVVEQLTAERDEMRGDLQRVAADFENYKRRAARERELAASATESKLLGELLSVIDDMERALDHAEQAQAEHPALADGVRMVHSKLDSVVRSHGLERVPTDILFDPNLHEAMMMQPSEDAEDGVILQVLQTGWQLGDRVLRHARVIVAGGA